MTRLEQLVQDSERLEDRSKAIYGQAVRSFVAFAGTDERRWSPELVQAWLAGMKGLVAPQTVNLYLRGLRFAAKRFEAMRYGEDFARAVEYRRGNERTRHPKALTPVHALRLLGTCPVDGTWVERRDRVILCFGLFEGLRREEMVRLDWSQWAHDIRSLLRLWRKGGKIEPRHPLARETDAALWALWNLGGPSTATGTARGFDRGHEALPILQRAWPALSRPGYTKAFRLTADGLYYIVHARAAQAGLRVSPHELRHTFGSLGLAAGVPLWRVQKAMNHEDVRTTSGTYAHDLQADEGEPVGESVRRLIFGVR